MKAMNRVFIVITSLSLVLMFQNCGKNPSLEMQGGPTTDQKYLSDINDQLSVRPPTAVTPIPNVDDGFSRICFVKNITEWKSCLALAATNQGKEGLRIYITEHLNLEKGEVLYVRNLSNLIIEGNHLNSGNKVTISETIGRARSPEVIDRHLLVVGEGTRNITIRNIVFRDASHATLAKELKKSCRVGGDPNNSKQARIQGCQALVVLGGGVRRPVADTIKVENSEFISNRTQLLHLLGLKQFQISYNKFNGGAYAGIITHAGTERNSGVIQGNEIKNAGTGGLQVFRVNDLTIQNNQFINNHRDPQIYDKTELVKSGQLQIVDVAEGESKDIRVIRNTFSTTSAIGRAETGRAIHVSGGAKGAINGLSIVGNEFYNIPLEAIYIGRWAGGSKNTKFLIYGNYIKNPFADRKGSHSHARSITINVLTTPWGGFELSQNKIVMREDSKDRELGMDIDGSEKECDLRPLPETTCAVKIKFKAGTLLAGTVIVIKKNGTVVHSFQPGQNNGEFLVQGIPLSGAMITLHEAENDIYPLAALNVIAKREQ